MATTTAKLYKMASEQSDAKSHISKSQSMASIKVPDSFIRPTTFSDLHRAYGKMKQSNFSKDEKERFKFLCNSKGFQPGPKFDKLLEDPEPHFNKLIKGLENFDVPTKKDWIKDAHEPSFPRYKRQGEVIVGTPQNDKLRNFHLYEKNKISKEEFRERLGESEFQRISPLMKNTEDGRYTHAVHELLIDQTGRETVNTNPVRNSKEIFGRVYAPAYRKLK